MRIAIAGTRGIPASYGGFETFAEELSVRLTLKGHSILVYGRRPFFRSGTEPGPYRNVLRRNTPTIFHKYLETPIHSLTTFIDLFFRRVDLVLLCNAANSPFSWLVRLSGKKLITNVDGIERMRSKWNRFGKIWYALGERSAVLFSNVVVADADVIKEYYLQSYGITSTVITYGAEAKFTEPGEILKCFKLKARSYILYVSRLEPENNALGVIEAYSKLNPEMPLVIVGDAPYATTYKEDLRRAAGPNVVFTGFQFGQAYHELQSNCYLYIQATEVGGTHPALVEAMAYGNCIIANGTPENREVLGDAGCFYAKNDFDQLALELERLMLDSKEVSGWGAKARQRANERYNWEKVTDEYEKLFLSLL